MRIVIKPIETIYKGYRFRSRLEARWAVFFDHLGIPYDYEREGYQTEFGWYLPDFYIFPYGETPYGYIVEVKPDIPTDTEKLKLASLVFELPSYTEALLLIGSPNEHSPMLHYSTEPTDGKKGARWWEQYVLGLFFADANAKKCTRAFTAARQARFEYGESG